MHDPDIVLLLYNNPLVQDLIAELAKRIEKDDPDHAKYIRMRLSECGYDPDKTVQRVWVRQTDAALSERDQAQRRLRMLFDIAFRPVGPHTSADNTLGHLQAHLELARLAGHIPDKPPRISDRGN